MAEAHVLIPAAGAARRMRGADKLLEPVDGIPLLARQVRAAREGGARRIWVTLPPEGAARRAVLPPRTARVIEVPDWSEGLSASIRAGTRVAAGLGASGLLVLLADLPEITADDIARVLAAHAGDPDAIWRGTDADGGPGHPVLIPRRLFERLARVEGDAGAREVLREEAAAVRGIALPGAHATTDLDTPEAWAAWRAARGG